ncbi:MAG: hypothetical protein AB7Q16_05950 [Vicinamibacterales bacterium]
MRRGLALVGLLVVLGAAGPAAQTVTGARFQLTSGPCTVRAGVGAPASGLGSACDVYVRTDTPFGVYHKLDATTWVQTNPGTGTTGDLYYASSATAFGRLSAVASGQVLASAGTGTAPMWTASPTATLFTGTGNPGFVVSNANAQFRLQETDASTDNGGWVFRAQNEAFDWRTLNDAGTAATTFLSVARTGLDVDSITLQPNAGDIILAPGGLDILPDTGYTKNLGALTNKFLTLHAAELWVETLVAQNTMATIGGRILVGPTTTLTSDLAAAATSMVVKHNSLANGDRVVLQANGALEWMAVTSAPSGSGPYTYSVTRDLDGTGANDWTAGDAVFNTGTTGNGFIDLYSVAGVIPGSTAGPTIVGNVRTGTTYSQVAPRWAIGNLDGTFGYGATTYGAAFGDPSATHLTIDATNGLRIRNGATNKLTADTSGNLAIVGSLSVGTSGSISSGATAYGTGTGYWLAYNGGTPQVRVGTTSGNRLAWDGTDLTLVSANATLDSAGVTITPATTTDDTRAYRFTVPTGRLGMYGADAGGAGVGRYLRLWNEWTGTGNYANGVQTLIGAWHTPSSGGTSRRCDLIMGADGSTSSLTADGCLTLYFDGSFNTIGGGQLSMGTRIQFTTNTGVEVGGIGKTSANGLTVRGVTGSTYEFYLESNAGNGVIAVPAGTVEIQLGGVSLDGTGKVLCVKSDATIGTCTTGVGGSGTCTCS